MDYLYNHVFSVHTIIIQLVSSSGQFFHLIYTKSVEFRFNSIISNGIYIETREGASNKDSISGRREPRI